jgi:hypothetical protein
MGGPQAHAKLFPTSKRSSQGENGEASGNLALEVPSERRDVAQGPETGQGLVFVLKGRNHF